MATDQMAVVSVVVAVGAAVGVVVAVAVDDIVELRKVKLQRLELLEAVVVVDAECAAAVVGTALREQAHSC